MRPLVLGIVKGLVLGALLLGVLSMMSFDYWKTFDWCPQERWDFGLLAVAVGGGIGSFFGLLSGGAALRRHQDLKYLVDQTISPAGRIGIGNQRFLAPPQSPCR